MEEMIMLALAIGILIGGGVAWLLLDRRSTDVERLVGPIGDSLARVDVKLEALERDRVRSQGALGEQLRALSTETSGLRTALHSPTARGRWGELQLRRVCEVAGMAEHCDFVQQAHADGARPDLLVALPGGKQVVVDAKTPLQAYLAAHEAQSEPERAAHLAAFGRHVRGHVSALSAKAYWSRFESAPEFVVLFLPSESLFSAALEQCPDLIETGSARSVIVASPTTLIALLRAVAHGWREERAGESAREVAQLGKELYGRLCVMSGHMAKTGRSLEAAVRAHNEAIGSFESRVLVTARRFDEYGAAPAARDLPVLEPVVSPVRLGGG
jgi:DNA recombination protein RmuC